MIGGTVERPIHLYLRLHEFIRDNLLLSGGKIKHDGAVPATNEKISATTERLIVLRWLELLHPRLPQHIGKVFSNELRSQSLKDLQPQILEQVDDLLRQIQEQRDESEASLMFTSISGNRFGKYQKQPKHWNSRGNYNYSKSDTEALDQKYEPRRKFVRRETGTHHQSRVKKCDACKAVGEPFIGHSVQECPNISARDRQNMLKTFALDVSEEMDDEGEYAEEFHEEEEQQVSQVLMHQPPVHTEEVSTSRISIKPSPRINVKILNTH